MNILPSKNFIDVYERLSFIASDVLVKTINNIENSKPIKQDINSISYAKKITKSDAELNLNMNANFLVRRLLLYFVSLMTGQNIVGEYLTLRLIRSPLTTSLNRRLFPHCIIFV